MLYIAQLESHSYYLFWQDYNLENLSFKGRKELLSGWDTNSNLKSLQSYGRYKGNTMVQLNPIPAISEVPGIPYVQYPWRLIFFSVQRSTPPLKPQINVNKMAKEIWSLPIFFIAFFFFFNF